MRLKPFGITDRLFLLQKFAKISQTCYCKNMLIDDITVRVKGGDGGNGAVAFQKIKFAHGPTGTSGGKGGSVFAEGVSDLGALNQYRFKKEVRAERGMNGRSQFRDGEDGKDETLLVPVGTVIHNLDTGEDKEVVKVGERICLAKGGRGGRGNFHFRSATNTTPKEKEDGHPGQEFSVRLELKLIADIGLIGYPNAGKSSLLNELSNAKAKVANYQFTTLEPNMGAYYDLIIADIPGLIEGASEGKGLGIKFLRHVERTRVLFHLVSSEAEDVAKEYEATRAELGKYNPLLLEKTEYVFLSKSDAVTPAELKKKLSALKKKNNNTFALSILDDESLKKVKEVLAKISKEK
jgi:GTP-binding protein